MSTDFGVDIDLKLPLFLPARRYAMLFPELRARVCVRVCTSFRLFFLPVCLSVYHMPILCSNGQTQDDDTYMLAASLRL